mgnify:CR=1 FL=1
MKDKKISRTFRLNQAAVDKLLYLQALYSKRMGIKLSQADILEMLINHEYDSVDKDKKI